MYLILEHFILGFLFVSAVFVSCEKKQARLAIAFMSIFFITALMWIILRVSLHGHAPFSGFYESLVFFGILYLSKVFLLRKDYRKIIVIPGLLLIITGLLTPMNLKEAGTVAATLQSPWIFIHVPAYFLAYVSLSLAAVYVCLSFLHRSKKNKWTQCIQEELRQSWFFSCIGLVTGAIWADLSWGRFWSWDPKETWALVTIVLIAIALHCKKNTIFKKMFIILAFLLMLWTYFGVTFFLKGLHSYL